MIVRGAAVVVLRAILLLVCSSVVMGDAVRMGRNFPVLKGMNPMHHREQRQANQPEDTKIRQDRH